MDPCKITTRGDRTGRIYRNTGDGGFTFADVYRPNGEPFLGFRWNGENEADKGYPNAYGKPTWAKLPDEIAPFIRGYYEAFKLTQ
jgi:hypothetical protein